MPSWLPLRPTIGHRHCGPPGTSEQPPLLPALAGPPGMPRGCHTRVTVELHNTWTGPSPGRPPTRHAQRCRRLDKRSTVHFRNKERPQPPRAAGRGRWCRPPLPFAEPGAESSPSETMWSLFSSVGKPAMLIAHSRLLPTLHDGTARFPPRKGSRMPVSSLHIALIYSVLALLMPPPRASETSKRLSQQPRAGEPCTESKEAGPVRVGQARQT